MEDRVIVFVALSIVGGVEASFVNGAFEDQVTLSGAAVWEHRPKVDSLSLISTHFRMWYMKRTRPRKPQRPAPSVQSCCVRI
jgi:hypothetical protein